MWAVVALAAQVWATRALVARSSRQGPARLRERTRRPPDRYSPLPRRGVGGAGTPRCETPGEAREVGRPAEPASSEPAPAWEPFAASAKSLPRLRRPPPAWLPSAVLSGVAWGTATFSVPRSATWSDASGTICSAWVGAVRSLSCRAENSAHDREPAGPLRRPSRFRRSESRRPVPVAAWIAPRPPWWRSSRRPLQAVPGERLHR